MKGNELYAGAWLKAVDLGGRAIQAQISEVSVETFDNGQKLALHLTGKSQGLVLNKTNYSVIARKFGDETDNWTGQVIEIYPEDVPYQGKMVESLRVRIPVAPAEPIQPVAAPAPVESAPSEFDEDASIPF